MCSDRTNTQMRSHLVRGADIGRGTRFVNQQEWGAPERTRPDRRGHVVRRADEALVDWRLATDRTPGSTAEGARTQTTCAGPFPVTEELHTDGRP